MVIFETEILLIHIYLKNNYFGNSISYLMNYIILYYNVRTVSKFFIF